MLRREDAVDRRKQEAGRKKPATGDDRDRPDQLVDLFFQRVVARNPADGLNRQQAFAPSIEEFAAAHSQMLDIRAAIWSDTARLFHSYGLRDLDVGGSV